MKNDFKLQEFASETILDANHSPAEYLLVLQPHEELWNEIKSIKDKFAIDFKCESARMGLPHITLATFKQYQATESHIRQALRNSIKVLEPFKIEMKDFGSFPSHTIYINCKQGANYGYGKSRKARAKIYEDGQK